MNRSWQTELPLILALSMFAACGRSELELSPSPAGNSDESDTRYHTDRPAGSDAPSSGSSRFDTDAGPVASAAGSAGCPAPIPTGMCVEYEDNLFGYEGRRAILEESTIESPGLVFDSIRIRSSDPDGERWSLEFSPVAGDFWNTGVYDPAMRYPFMAPGYAGFTLVHNGYLPSCGGLLGGRFEITELAFMGNGTLDRFAASFEEHCDVYMLDTKPRVWGAVNFNARGVAESPREHPDECTVPGSSGICLVSTTKGGRSGTSMPHNLAFGDSDGTLVVEFAADVLKAELDTPDPFMSWKLQFGVGDCPGAPPTPASARSADTPPPGGALLRVGGPCGNDIGMFEVRELRCEPTLEVAIAAIDFVRPCELDYVLHGKLRFNSDLP